MPHTKPRFLREAIVPPSAPQNINMRYDEMDVWLQAVALAVEVYAQTDSLPKEEWYGLSAQMRRAAVSIPSNVAEGEGRHFRRDHGRFILAARLSLYECTRSS